MILIAKETPHMFMWFSDGSKIPSGISPLPQNARLDYIKRLKEECGKLFITKTPVYLVYMGRLLNREQIALLEELQNEIPNLAVIDYDDVEQSISDPQITSKVAAAASSYSEHEKLNVGNGGIADLVDFTRLILLYNSKTLRDIAQKKITIPLEWREGLIYRDFDVTLEKETMSDIPTTHGHMATLNFLEKVHGHHTHLIELANGEEALIQRIDIFFNTYIYNLEHYQQILRLFLNGSLNAEEQQAKQALISEYKKICREDNFEFIFIRLIRIENSFLAISTDQHPLIHKMIKEVVQGDSPYGVVQLNFRTRNPLTYLSEFLTPQLLGFNIGNDLTWKMSVKEQHTSEGSTTVTRVQLRKSASEDLSPPPAKSVINILRTPLAGGSENSNELQDQVTVNKLSKLSKNYLAHLKKTSKKNNFLIGNDLTWKMSVQEQHTSEGLTTVTRVQLRNSASEDLSPPPAKSVVNILRTPLAGGSENSNELQDQVTVNKLSKLSKNYLAHLKKTSKKNNFLDKYNLMLELNAILDHPSNDPSTKLSEFSSRLQEVDKGILKNHREPNWVMFKKAALFLLGVTVVGALVGLVDYALRRHHSIFCASKSHGERFILDVEEHIPKARIS